MASPSDSGVVDTLSRRTRILRALESDPRSKRDLADALEVSRSTVDRGVRELEVLGFVERCEEGYRLSSGGRLARTEYDRTDAALEAIGAAADLLAHLPRDAPMSVRMLEGATTQVPDPHAPNEPFEALTDLIEDATRFRGVSGAERVPELRHVLYERTVEDDLDAEAVFTERLVEFLSDSYPETVRAVIDDGGFDIHTIPEIPYGLGIFETPAYSCALVVVHEDPADVHGIIQNDTPDALEWAEETYRRFREAARPVDPPG